MVLRRIHLTIFQKMLVAPLIGLLLYAAYLAYSYNQHQHSSRTIEQIRDGYLPVLALASENIMLFNALADAMKDAVLAGEREWVIDTRKQHDKILANIEQLGGSQKMVPETELETLKARFEAYYDNAFALSMAMLEGGQQQGQLEGLIDDFERLYAAAQSAFVTMSEGVQQRLNRQVDETNARFRRLLWLGVGMGVLLSLLITAITFTLSLSTRRSLAEVNQALKRIAQETPDLSARLTRSSNDELGELVGWFNLLSEKLEHDYKKIELLSITDKLTQLYNRTKIDDLFKLELSKVGRYQEPLAVIMLDLDHFKSVNDSYGHQVGDRVLQELAAILRENVRDCDHLGRWGGEEFIIIAPNTDLSQAHRQAEKLRQAIEAYDFSEVGHKTGSFGVATYRSGDSEASLTRRADDCLYLAKERGRNTVIDEDALVHSEGVEAHSD